MESIILWLMQFVKREDVLDRLKANLAREIKSEEARLEVLNEKLDQLEIQHPYLSVLRDFSLEEYK